MLVLSSGSPGQLLGAALSFPPAPHIPQAGLAAPIGLGMLLGLGLCRGARAEIVDGAFSPGAKARNTFLLVPCGVCSVQLPSCAAGTGMACTGAWNHSRVGRHCPEPASF